MRPHKLPRVTIEVQATMEARMKRKYCCENEEENTTSDDEWQPESPEDGSEGEEAKQEETLPKRHTRSHGPVERPADPAPIHAAMDEVDKVVDDESDLSSDTESEDEEDFESCEEEEEEEESDEEDDYSDDDSFVTSNEDADREERDEIFNSYERVFTGEFQEEEEGDGMPAEDLSIGGEPVRDDYTAALY
jgi:hypothetical protein